MEKYSQYRDRGSGIAPFFPIPPQPAGALLPFYVFLFVFKLPLLLFVTISYFLIFSWLPIGSGGKKAGLWMILGIPGMWWVDLQIDGVKKGSLAQHYRNRLPDGGSIIASTFTSPIDALYLAAIFDPVFTISYPKTTLVQPVNLIQAMLRALSPPELVPPFGVNLVDLATLVRKHPDQPIAVFPECTTTNGRGILPFSPSLLTTPKHAKIFPISIKYSPPDITTPVPGSYITFIWLLCSGLTHSIRVRIAEPIYNTSAGTRSNPDSPKSVGDTFDADFDVSGDSSTIAASDDGSWSGLRPDEKQFLDTVGKALERLGRVKRVGLGVKEKIDFMTTWKRRRRRQFL